MQLRKFMLFLTLPFFLYGCGSAFEHNRAGMEKLSKELKEEFGANAWYTSIELANSGGSDDLVTVDQTKDPNSLKQEQWSQFHGFWDKKADITLSVQGAEPRSFMFQLDKEASLGRLGDLMEESKKRLDSLEQVDDAWVTLAQIKASKTMNTKEEGIYYSIVLESHKKRKSYNFVYNLDGSLRKLNK